MRYLSLVLLFFSFSSFADCDYFLKIPNTAIEVTGNSQVIEVPIQIRREKSNSGKCNDYRIYFSKGLAQNYQRKAFTLLGFFSMSYNLHKNVNQSGILKERNDAVNSNEYLDGTMPEKSRYYTDTVYVSIPGLGSSYVYAGFYYDVVQASAYSRDNGFLIFETNENVSLMFYVNQTVQISIMDEGGTFNSGSTTKVLDFGYLTLNAEKGADVRVLSNGSYQLKLSSQNNGVLRQSQDTISYSLRVNGALVNLSSSASSSINIGSGNATTTAGDLYNLKVKIEENTRNKSAGMYQDIITITAIAN